MDNYKMDKFSKCIGCGYCCLQSPCAVSVSVYGITSLCPALHWNEYRKRYLCSIFKIAVNQFSDEGCSSSLNSWRKGVRTGHVKKKYRKHVERRLEIEKERASETQTIAVSGKGKLYELLVKERKSVKDTANILQCSVESVQYAIKKLKITIPLPKQRTLAAKKDRWKQMGLTKRKLIKLYNTERKTLGEMAKILDCGKDLLQSAMDEYGIPRRHKMAYKGVQTSVYAPEKEIKWIETIASREHKSQSEIIREGLKLVIQKYAQTA